LESDLGETIDTFYPEKSTLIVKPITPELNPIQGKMGNKPK